jgi:hypothetical protein
MFRLFINSWLGFIATVFGACLLAVTLFAPAARSQSAALSVLEHSDGTLGGCNPQEAVDNQTLYNLYGYPCCGSPGRRQCAKDEGHGRLLFSCLSGEQFLNDPEGGQFCNVPVAEPVATNLLPAARPVAGTDFTFYATSDQHFYRIDYAVQTQATHPVLMNQFAISSAFWPSGAGIPSAPIHPPTAIIVPGDLGMCGGPEMLGSFRLLWEQGHNADSIQYPVYFGLGNHDMSALPGGYGCSDLGSAQRMWLYLYTRTKNLHADQNPTGCLVGIDPGCVDLGGLGGSQNYSWDWHGVHMVMFNTWAGTTDRAYPVGADGLTWLKKDLAHYVGTSNSPVILFQHYTLGNVGNEWSQTDYHNFWQVIQNYNVIGIFSGHTHSLGTASYNSVNSLDYPINPSDRFASVAHQWNNSFIDNFVDGSGGTCWNEQCSGGSPNFLTVRVTDHYLDVAAITENIYGEGSPNFTVGDTAMGFVNNAKACRKRINSPYTPWPGTLTSSSTQYSYTNTTGALLTGPISITYPGLTSPDFMDACVRVEDTAGTIFQGSGHKILLNDGETLGAGATKTITLSDRPGTASISMYLLRDSIEVSTPTSNGAVTSLSLGSVPEQVNLSTHLGQNKVFLAKTDAPWLVYSNPSGTATFPLQVVLSAVNPPTTNATAHLTIASADTSIPATVITVSVQTAQLSITGSGGKSITVNKTVYPLPYSGMFTVGSQVTVSADEVFSGSALLYFRSWSDNLAKTHTITLQPGGLSLTATFGTAYKVSATLLPATGGTLTYSSAPVNPAAAPADTDYSYYPAGTLSVTAQAAPRYLFIGYSGAFIGTSATQSATLNGPLTFSVSFANGVNLSLRSGSSGGHVIVDNIPYPGSATVLVLVNSPHLISADMDVPDIPGVRYDFQMWSDENTTLTRTIQVGTQDIFLTASYQKQALLTTVASPSDVGTVTGGGWYVEGTPATVTANPLPGFQFAKFADSNSAPVTTNPRIVTINSPLTETATFMSSGAPGLSASPGGARTDGEGGVRLVPITLTNAGPGGALGAQVTSILAKAVSGTGIVTNLSGGPVFGDLAAGASATQSFAFLWPTTATQVSVLVNYTSTNGVPASTLLNLSR